MSVEDAPQCTYCSRFGHHAEECKVSRLDQRMERTFGWISFVLMAPFAVCGFMAGLALSGFMAGLRFSKDMWTVAWKRLFSREPAE